MKRKKIVILLSAFLLILLLIFMIYNYTFNSKHRDITSEEATIILSASDLFSDFQKDEALASTMYLDKVIEIKGLVSASDDSGIVLNDQIQVEFNAETTPKVPVEKSLTLKGRCVGYDELLEMVKIDQATIIK